MNTPSPKSLTNKKFTTSEEYRNAWERIFRKKILPVQEKEPTETETADLALCSEEEGLREP